ncbi:MAG: hypothetical protein JOZ80_08460, partial [Acidobacteriaceae bacterium]|nr:hypothetical protein [Acidobacteriaceae bacterium]
MASRSKMKTSGDKKGDKVESLNPKGSSTEKQDYPIVAVGASAGGVEAFSELLRKFPE